MFTWEHQRISQSSTPGLEVIKLEFILKLKIKCNDWLLACHVFASGQSLRFFAFETELKFYDLEANISVKKPTYTCEILGCMVFAPGSPGPPVPSLDRPLSARIVIPWQEHADALNEQSSAFDRENFVRRSDLVTFKPGQIFGL